MTSITQTIPSYAAGGISQQPDQFKNPGQVSDAINVIPDITEGLIKRPGSSYIKTLSTSTNATYFHYYRDDVEQYIGQVERTTNSAPTVKMWCLKNIPALGKSAGDEMTVNAMSTEITDYLKHSDPEDLQFSTINDYTYITNRTKVVAMDTATESASRLNHNCAYIELKQTANARQYAFNLFTSNAAYTLSRTVTRLKHMEDYPVSGASVTKDTLGGTIAAVTIPDHTFTRWNGSDDWTYAFMATLANTNGDQQPAINYSPNTAGQPVHTRWWRNAANNGNYSWANDASCPDVGTEVHTSEDANIKIYDKNHVQLTDAYANNPYDTTGTKAWESGAKYFLDQRVIHNSIPYICIKEHTGSSTDPADDVSGGGTNWSVLRRRKPKNLTWRFTVKGNTERISGSGSGNEPENYHCVYDYDIDLLHGGEGWERGDYVTFTHDAKGFSSKVARSNAGDPNNNVPPDPVPTNLNVLYMVQIDDTSIAYVKADLLAARPPSTASDNDTAVNAMSILGDLQEEVARITNLSDEDYQSSTDKQVTSTIVGNGLYLTRPGTDDTNSFNIETSESDIMNVFGKEINDVSKLPTQCVDGYIVKVLNSDIEEDDYYLKFKGDNGNHGPGSWVETPEPGIDVEYDPKTMPLQLVRESNGSFTVQQVAYKKRGVGDDNTNPKATFVGSTINKVLFWRNRVAFLSANNVILSQPGDANITQPNFWAKTALTLSPEDVIDLTASSTYPSKLLDGIETPAGLLLFSQNQQFLMTAEAEVLTADTAKVDPIASYNYNTKNPPVSLGTSIGFLDNAGKNTRLFEMVAVQRSREPAVLDQSTVIPNLLPKGIDLITSSRENNVIFLGVTGTNTIYGYRYFNSGEKRVQSAWFKWTLRKNVKHLAVIDDALYVLDSVNNLTSFDLKNTDTTANIDTVVDANNPIAIDHNIHLDNYTELAASNFTYSNSTNKTTFTLPTGFESGIDVVVIDDTPNDGTNKDFGRYEIASVSGTTATLNGDWDTNNHDLYIGYNYDMEVTFPTIYVTQTQNNRMLADINASVVVHRIKLGLGDSGVYETTIKRDGKDDYTELIESSYQDLYQSNTSPWLTERTHTLPVYERNTNLTFSLKSTHPSPATIYSMSWEGDYTNRYYKRV